MGAALSKDSNFWILFSSLAAVLKDCANNPSKILNPQTALSQKDGVYFQLFLLIVTTTWTYVRGKFKDWSAVDRLWSVSPVIYALSWLIHNKYNGHPSNQRHVLMVILATLWGTRLTANFYVKGGYQEQDYRWEYVLAWFKKNTMKDKILKELFYIGFVNLYQNSLIWSFINFPMYITSDPTLKNNLLTKLNKKDLFLASIWFMLFGIEVKSDLEMWYFQKDKKKYFRNKMLNEAGGTNGDGESYNSTNNVSISKKKAYERGFYCNGLYGYSRHPNYFGEVGMWHIMSLFSTAMYGGFVHWSIISSIHLNGLLISTAIFAENISSKKYPQYKLYQQRVPMMFPSLFAKSMD